MEREPYFKKVDDKWYVWDSELEEYVEDTESKDDQRQQATQ